MTGEGAVEVRGVVKRFGAEVLALDGLDLRIEAGETGLAVSEVREVRRPLRDVFLDLTGRRTGGADSLRPQPPRRTARRRG